MNMSDSRVVNAAEYYFQFYPSFSILGSKDYTSSPILDFLINNVTADGPEDQPFNGVLQSNSGWFVGLPCGPDVGSYQQFRQHSLSLSISRFSSSSDSDNIITVTPNKILIFLFSFKISLFDYLDSKTLFPSLLCSEERVFL